MSIVVYPASKIVLHNHSEEDFSRWSSKVLEDWVSITLVWWEEEKREQPNPSFPINVAYLKQFMSWFDSQWFWVRSRYDSTTIHAARTLLLDTEHHYQTKKKENIETQELKGKETTCVVS